MLDRLSSKTSSANAVAQIGKLLRNMDMTWDRLIVAAPSIEDAMAWPAQALALLQHPGVTDAESVTLRKLSLWRSPGASGLAQVRAIAERLAVPV